LKSLDGRQMMLCEPDRMGEIGLRHKFFVSMKSDTKSEYFLEAVFWHLGRVANISLFINVLYCILNRCCRSRHLFSYLLRDVRSPKPPADHQKTIHYRKEENNMKNPKYKILLTICIFSGAALSGCGGGSNASPSALAPVASPSTVAVNLPATVPLVAALAEVVIPHQTAKTPDIIATLQACPADAGSAIGATGSPVGGGVVDLKVVGVVNAPGDANTSITLLGVDGKVYTSGANGDLTNGLGPDAPLVINVPTPLNIGRPVRRLVSATMALDDQGGLWGWGTFPWDSKKTSRTPVRITSLVGLVKIAQAQFGGFLALQDDGSVHFIGYPSGPPTVAADPSQIPVKKIQGVAGITDIATLSSTNFALGNSGIVYTWGYSNALAGRIASNATPIDSPWPVGGLPKVTKLFIVANTPSVFAQAANGEIWYWGFATYDAQRTTTSSKLKPGEVNNFGIDGVDSHVSLPRLHPTLNNLKSVSQNRSHITAIGENGDPMGWGLSYGIGYFYYSPTTLLKLGSGVTNFSKFGTVDDFKIPAFDQVLWLKNGVIGAFNASGANAEFADACAPAVKPTIKFKSLLPDVTGTFMLTETGEVWIVEYQINRNRGDGFVNTISPRRYY
jgi:hypothetical protein